MNVRTRRFALVFVRGLLTATLLLTGCPPQEPSIDEHFFRGSTVWGTPRAPEIALVDQQGRPFRLGEQRGSAVLLFFGYVYCPDVCPATLAGWSRVQKMLGDKAERVRFVLVTVDPERDTSERLAAHMSVFGSGFIGLTGSSEALEQVYRSYEIDHEKIQLFESASGYLVEHTPHTFLVDPGGTLRLQYEFGAPPEDIATDIEWLLDHAPTGESSAIQIADVWSRPAADTGPGVVYLSITNAGPRNDRLVAVRAAVCETAEIHRTAVDGDRMRMSPARDGVEIPAGQTVRFEPGGLHVMLMALRRELGIGERFEVVLEFENGGEIHIESEVRGS